MGEERRERDVEAEIDVDWGSGPIFELEVAKFHGRDLVELGGLVTPLTGAMTSSKTMCEREFLESESERVFWLWICICRDVRGNEIVKCVVLKGGSE